MGVDANLAELGVDLVALERSRAPFIWVVDRDHDVGFCEEGQFHRFLQQASLALVETHL